MHQSLESKGAQGALAGEREFHLVAAVQQLALCGDEAAIISVLRSAARSLTSADGVTVVLREDEMCHYVEENAIGPLWKGQRFPLESCISGWCMLHHQQVAIPDIYVDARIPHDAYRPTFVKSLAMTPIGTREPLGALGAYWGREHHATSEELRILQALAAAAAGAVDNIQLLARLREETRRKDQLLSLLAHELRNPLAPLSNCLQIMRHGVAAEQLGELRGVMERQVAQLVRLIDDLLDLARVNRGELRLRRAPLELGAVLHAALETSRPAIDAASHALSIAAPAEPLHVDGDAMRLAQVLAILLDNAAKYTPRGGRIELAAGRDGTEALVRVRDSGRGVAPERLGELFDAGIGLALAKKLVELHGGRIEAASAGAGQGAEFRVRLPLAQAPARAASAAAAREQPAPSAKRVLVVDDNVDAAATLAMLLRGMGHAVEVAHDGRAALELARRRPPELVLLDLAMPGMDGHEVAARLRAEIGTPMQIVALTGYGDERSRSRSRASGFDHHLVKPVDPPALASLFGP